MHFRKHLQILHYQELLVVVQQQVQQHKDREMLL
jgi:hypothetical protein